MVVVAASEQQPAEVEDRMEAEALPAVDRLREVVEAANWPVAAVDPL